MTPYDSIENHGPNTPILASIFRVLGALVLLATIAVVVLAVKTEGPIQAAIIAGASGGFSALVLFGIAQMLVLIAKIESNTSGAKDAAILQSLHKIEGHLEALRESAKEGREKV